MVNDVKAFAAAEVRRINAAVKEASKQRLKEVIDSRNNFDIIQHLEQNTSDFKSAVLYLTANNDPESLESILRWGSGRGLKVEWEEDEGTNKRGKGSEEEKNGRRNPIIISSQQGYVPCTKLLHRFGYRIPQIRGSADPSQEGKHEKLRQAKISSLQGEQGDQVKKFLAFKAYTRPHYLSLAFTEENKISDVHPIDADDIKDLQLLDPLRRAFELAEEAENFSSNFTGMSNFRKHYASIQDDLEIFSHDLLTQCSNMDEVKMLLMHNPEDDDDDDDDVEEKNWEKALLEGRKDFVAHPFFQQYFWKMMAGFSSPSKMSQFHWQWIYAPYVLALYCILPFVVFADFFRKADLLFVSPSTFTRRRRYTVSLHDQMKKNLGHKDQDEDDSLVDESCFFQFFRTVVHTPVFRMILHDVIQWFYLSMLLVCLWAFWRPTKKESLLSMRIDRTMTDNYLVVAAVIFTMIFLLEDIKMIVMKRYLFFKSFWNPFNFISHLLLVIGSSILKIFFSYYAEGKSSDDYNRATISGNHPISIGMTLISISVGMEIFKKLRYMMLFQFLGPIVLCITSVFKDIVRVASIYGIIYISMTVTLWSLLKPFQEQKSGVFHNYTLSSDSELTSSKNLWGKMFWLTFEPDGPSNVQVVKAGEHPENWSYEFSHLVGICVWAMYQIIMIILMLNVLISIMNTTYMTMWACADKEWKYSKTYFQSQFLAPRAVFPAPFSPFYYLTLAIYRCRRHKKQGEKRILEQKANYFKLLKRLTQGKQQAEYENSEEDNINDLKVDLLNQMRKMSRQIKNDIRN